MHGYANTEHGTRNGTLMSSFGRTCLRVTIVDDDAADYVVPHIATERRPAGDSRVDDFSCMHHGEGFETKVTSSSKPLLSMLAVLLPRLRLYAPW